MFKKKSQHRPKKQWTLHLLEHSGKIEMRTKNSTSRILADLFERLGLFLPCLFWKGNSTEFTP